MSIATAAPVRAQPLTSTDRETNFANLDAAYAAYLDAHPSMPDRWLLVQTLLTARERRMMLGMLACQPGSRVLDAGSGFGQVPLELAASVPVHAIGIDVDPANLAVAATIRESLFDGGGWRLCNGSTVELAQGSIYELPVRSASVDLVICRFVYQHLADPVQATAELFRVLREGGQAVLVDIDDQFAITHPEHSKSLASLQDAFRRLQASNGGDRFVGRKLAGYLAGEGFHIATTMLWPQAAYLSSRDAGAGRLFEMERLRNARDAIVARGILTASEIDWYLNSYEAEDPGGRFSCNAQVLAVGQKLPGNHSR